jgi:hypothetical protein
VQRIGSPETLLCPQIRCDLGDFRVDGEDAKVGEGFEKLSIEAAELLVLLALRNHQDFQKRQDGRDEVNPALFGSLEDAARRNSKFFVPFEVVDEQHRIHSVERGLAGP